MNELRIELKTESKVVFEIKQKPFQKKNIIWYWNSKLKVIFKLKQNQIFLYLKVKLFSKKNLHSIMIRKWKYTQNNEKIALNLVDTDGPPYT